MLDAIVYSMLIRRAYTACLFAPPLAQAFWKGTWAAQILSMIYSSVQFTTYHSIFPAILVQFLLVPLSITC